MLNNQKINSYDNLSLAEVQEAEVNNFSADLPDEEIDYQKPDNSPSWLANGVIFPIMILLLISAIAYWGYTYWQLSSHSLITEQNHPQPSSEKSPAATIDAKAISTASENSLSANETNSNKANNLINKDASATLSEKLNKQENKLKSADLFERLSTPSKEIEKPIKKLFTVSEDIRFDEQLTNTATKVTTETSKPLKLAKIIVKANNELAQYEADVPLDPYSTVINLEQNAAEHFKLGNYYAQKKSWRLAQYHYFAAHQQAAENPDIIYNLAVSLEQLGLTENALEYYRSALILAKIHPANFNLQVVGNKVKELPAVATKAAHITTLTGNSADIK